MQYRSCFLVIRAVLSSMVTCATALVAQEPNRQEAQQLHHKINDLLHQELTQHWYSHAVEHTRGGFHQSMAKDWLLQSDENIFLVYQARMTWTAAAFAQYSPPQHDEFVQFARHGIAFLDEVLRDKEFGGFHWLLDARGRLDP